MSSQDKTPFWARAMFRRLTGMTTAEARRINTDDNEAERERAKAKLKLLSK